MLCIQSRPNSECEARGDSRRVSCAVRLISADGKGRTRRRERGYAGYSVTESVGINREGVVGEAPPVQGRT